VELSHPWESDEAAIAQAALDSSRPAGAGWGCYDPRRMVETPRETITWPEIYSDWRHVWGYGAAPGGDVLDVPITVSPRRAPDTYQPFVELVANCRDLQAQRAHRIPHRGPGRGTCTWAL